MELKHRWATTHNFLAGLTAGAWWRLLRENRFEVSPAYWHRAAFVTLASLMNSAIRIREESRFGAEVDATEVTRPPVFILGHWRSGTTHLHNLLCQDRARFAFPNTYQVVNPHGVLDLSPVMISIVEFGLLLAVTIYDRRTLGRVHSATWFGAALIVLTYPAVFGLAQTEGWSALVTSLLGTPPSS